MGEKERAEALLQAAGVTGVAVQESPETVTLPKAELEALRAAAAPGAAEETPGQRYERERNEQQAAADAPFTLKDYDAMSAAEQRAFALTDAGDAAIDAAMRRER
jgi:hypothetical protein